MNDDSNRDEASGEPITSTDPTDTAESATSTEPTDAADSTSTTESTTRTMTDASDTQQPTARSEPSDELAFGMTASRLRGLLDRAALGALVLLAAVTALGFYRYTGSAIRTWVDPAYQPIVLAVFNIALLLVAVAGISVQLGRIAARGGETNTE